MGDVVQVRRRDAERIAELEGMLMTAMACGKKTEESRHVLFRALRAAAEGMNTALSPFATVAHRETTLRVVQQHLNAIVAAGCPQTPWPDIGGHDGHA